MLSTSRRSRPKREGTVGSPCQFSTPDMLSVRRGVCFQKALTKVIFCSIYPWHTSENDVLSCKLHGPHQHNRRNPTATLPIESLIEVLQSICMSMLLGNCRRMNGHGYHLRFGHIGYSPVCPRCFGSSSFRGTLFQMECCSQSRCLTKCDVNVIQTTDVNRTRLRYTCPKEK